MRTPKFTIITKKGVYDYNAEFDENWSEDLLCLQDEKLAELGISLFTTKTIHFFDSPFCDEETMEIDPYSAIDFLAIKDGADLVRYENGNVGFVAYYNGNVNGFEIIKESED